MEYIIEKCSEMIWGAPFLLLLIVACVYVTIVLKLPQIRILKSIFEFKKNCSPKNKKEQITSFKTLMTVLAGTLGIGNVTGVATAIVLGGVGSIFWIFVSSFFAMALSYAENYIVLKNRRYSKYEGSYGGTMYVLEDVLNKPKLAVMFSVFTLLATMGIGCMVQTNSLASMLNNNYNIKVEHIAIAICVISSAVIFAGKYKLAKLSSKIIPICSIAYILLCIGVLVVNSGNIIPAIKLIVKEAFTPSAYLSGSIITAISYGFSRGMFSNEAGMGSAPIFTATLEENDIERGARSVALSVVIDTLFLCTLTGITIVATNKYKGFGINEILQNTFSEVWCGNIILSICMIFFVIATIPCWQYYGEQAIKYLFKSNILCKLFKIVYIALIYIGNTVALNMVWNLSSIFNALMALPNIYMVFRLTNTLKNIDK